jgi:hypothetical protein
VTLCRQSTVNVNRIERTPGSGDTRTHRMPGRPMERPAAARDPLHRSLTR